MTAVGQNWSRTYTYRAAHLVHPRSVEELRDVVARSPRVGVLGTRHSFNDIADSDGLLVGLGQLPPDLSIDPAADTVRVAAQLRYGDVVERLDAAGYALANLASLPHISIGGACATATHGSGDATGNLATAVTALEVVLADGRQVTYHRDDPDFDGVVVHLGALGVVTHLHLRLVPRFDLRQVVYDDLEWDTVVGALDAVTASAYSVSLFTDLRRPRFNAWLKAVTADELPSTLLAAAKAAEPRHPVPEQPAASCTEQLGVPGSWYARLPHFRLEHTPSNGQEIQSEYVVDRADATAALGALAELAPVLAPVLQVCEVRTVAADDLWLSPAYHRDALCLHFTWRDDPDAIAGVMPALEERLSDLSARPHWGKVFMLGVQDLAACYERHADFSALATRLDPDGVFANDYLRRLGLVTT